MRYIHEKAKRAGRPPGEIWTTVRIIDSSKRAQIVADALPRLRNIGVDEVVVDTDWGVEGSAVEAYGVLSDGASQ